LVFFFGGGGWLPAQLISPREDARTTLAPT
jgi:hypothetical protein